MANISEWIKGITFFIFVSLLFYFLWHNIFSNLIDFVGTDMFNIGSDGNTSLLLMKGGAWVSFVILYLGVGGVYLIYAMMAGSTNEIKTQPLYFLVAIAVWSVMMPILTIIFGLVYFMSTTLATATGNMMDATSLTTANSFSWILALISMLGLIGFPFYFVLKGYGINLFGEKEEQLNG